ncbi:MAG: Tol-Pal system beta propeller repeat protein TolB [Candidatus Puniceispirillum sp.]|nr:Tol-Pal system beta propeller repeat protein TolB [Candidatus Pelagibacter sp.]MBA4283731.1 Tol-Pal system beta propeller repeat protein TolB [Candidatus Puniceispirillum sp.]
MLKKYKLMHIMFSIGILCSINSNVFSSSKNPKGVVQKTPKISTSYAKTFDKPKRIQITRGVIRAEPIAVFDFTNDQNGPDKDAEEISNIVSNDLKNSGLFAPMASNSFPQVFSEIIRTSLNFALWQKASTRFVLMGRVSKRFSTTTVHFYLYDVLTKQKILSKEVSGRNSRKVAHAVADLIYSRITNEAGFFNTKIVYAKPIGVGRKKTTQLWIMDYDGHHPKPLTDQKHLVLTPRFSPTGKDIAYLKVHNGKAEVFVMNLKTKRGEHLGEFEGMSFAPRYSPVRNEIVMSLTKDGKSAIYKMNLDNRVLTRLTKHVSIDTSPCFSPDGGQIVFTSDRAGREHIYIMNSDGSDVRRLTFGADKYSQPVWSPRGDLIAFTKQARIPGEGSKFYIGVMGIDGTGERMIADGWLVEEPCWSGNGRYLIFTKQVSVRQQTRLYMVDLTGYNQQWIKTKTAAYNGTWSPLVDSLD